MKRNKVPEMGSAKNAAIRTTAADALVVFGATGDLVHKMIFPALYAMARRGALNVPVVGVASSNWNLAQLRKHAADSIKQAGSLPILRSRSPRLKRAGKEFVGEQKERYLLEQQAGEETPYERLLSDAMAGDGALFTREDADEAAK